MSVEQIAVHLGVSKETIYRLLERKEMPAHRIGRLWRFSPKEVDAWVMKDGVNISKARKQIRGK
jgi:excisionase family DNA binding protein